MLVEDVARELGISERAVYRMVRSQLIPSRTVARTTTITKRVIDVDDGLVEKLKGIVPLGDAWGIRKILKDERRRF